MSKLFDFYKNNISKYYSTNVLLKIINDGTANIPPTMKEIFIKYYKKDYMRNGDDENYKRYLRITRDVLDKLFNQKNDSELLKYLKNEIDMLAQRQTELEERVARNRITTEAAADEEKEEMAKELRYDEKRPEPEDIGRGE